MLDVAIIGSGPAGVAAAINVRQRNRSLVLLGAAEVSHKLESAQEIANYPGFPEIGARRWARRFIGIWTRWASPWSGNTWITYIRWAIFMR